MSKFHELKVLEIKKETADAVSVTFDVPENLKNNFTYNSGQYITLKLNINGQLVNRSYSCCSSPFIDANISIAVKKVANGAGSVFICDHLKAGNIIEVMEPMGNFFTALHSENSIHYILFGGGSGITPMLSIIKSVLQVEPKSKITLFYGNRNEQSIIFKDALDKLSQQNGERLKCVHILDKPDGNWDGYTGMMNTEVCLKLLKENTDSNFTNAEFFICGPGPMMLSAKTAIESIGVLARHIHIEYFTAKADSEKHEANVGKGDQAISDGKTIVKIILDGREYEFEMSIHETILEAALDKGYDPPYSCMVAACCTCRAKLKAGKIRMDDRESLTDDEIKQGYVLSCQSHPITHGVILSYDE